MNEQQFSERLSHESWWQPRRARKLHYFVEGRSLCGHWGCIGSNFAWFPDWREHSGLCAKCKRGLGKRVEANDGHK